MSIQTVHPYLSVSDAKQAIEFYASAFDAIETGPRLSDPSGQIMHTELQIGDSTVMLADESPDFGNHSPTSLGGTSVRLNLEVASADEVVAAAVAAGAEIAIPLADQFYGYRSGRIVDPFGHAWIVSQKLQDMTQAEMQTQLDALFQGDSE